MSLFAIQRFDGETEQNESVTQQQILEELHRTAAQRASDKKAFNKTAKKSKRKRAASETKSDLELDEQIKNKKKIKKIEVASPTKKIKSKPENKDIQSESDTDESSDDTDAKLPPSTEPEVQEQTSISQPKSKDYETNQVIGGFTVIGDVRKRTNDQVQRVLPEWLARPSVVEADILAHQTPFSDIPDLDDVTLAKLRENKITSFFPVQSQIIPALLSGVKTGFLSGPMGYRPPDICCSAPTGSGKTLAFVIPIVQALKTRVSVEVRALVILPTRDLANQVHKVFETFISGTDLRLGMAHGHKSFAAEQESLVRRCARGYINQADIVVATPGRLVDHINQTEGFSLKHLRFLVVDEADRVMLEIQQDWLSAVERAVNSHNAPLVVSSSRQQTCFQKLLFSATLSQNPEKLQQLNLFQPKLFTSVHYQDNDTEISNGYSRNTGAKDDFVGKYTTPAGLTEYFLVCKPAEKPLVLLYYILHLKFKQILCFTNSVESAHRLCWLINLVGGIQVAEVTRNLQAVKRARLLEKFEAGEIQMLVCSDAIARGMDIDNVKYVISYETTPNVNTYVHRVGRTARAGKVGTAVTLLEKKEVFHFKKLLKNANKSSVKELKINRAHYKPYAEPVSNAIKKLPQILKSEKYKQAG